MQPPDHTSTHAATIFPVVRGNNLNRRTFNLPADFEGQRNLVIVAFKREQQDLIDTWTDAVARLLARYPDLRFYELPTIGRSNPLFRAWVDGGMRAGIPDQQAREHTITLYLDKAAFRQALAVPHEDAIYVLLLDRAGRVIWRAEGQYSAPLAADLERVLARGAHADDVASTSGRAPAT